MDSSDLTAGFAWDVAMLGRDTRGQLKPGAKGTIRSDFITPRFRIPLSGYRLDAGAGRVGFITMSAHESAFHSLASDAATVSN